jgi:hypothetical protein
MRIATLSLLTILCLAVAAPASADLYNNGPINGTSGAYFIDVDAVSDSFVPTVDGSTNQFTFGEWVPAGATPLTVDWAIGTSSFGSDIGAGGDFVEPGLICSSGQPYGGGICGGGLGYDVYISVVRLPDIPLIGGQTYWLTLTNATDDFGGRDAWDINSGGSLAFHNLLGEVPSESFTIFSGISTGTTPEPSSMVLFSSGILAIANEARRKRSRR